LKTKKNGFLEEYRKSMVTCTHFLYLFLKSFITETRQILIVGSTIKLGMLYECEMSETLLLGSLITFIL
jgi:hypothetical protein